MHVCKLTHWLLFVHVPPWLLRQTFCKLPCVEHKRPAWHWLSAKQVSPNWLVGAQYALTESKKDPVFKFYLNKYLVNNWNFKSKNFK